MLCRLCAWRLWFSPGARARHRSAGSDHHDAQDMPIVDSVPADGRVISDLNIELCQATSADKPHTVDEAMLALKLAGKRSGCARASPM